MRLIALASGLVLAVAGAPFALAGDGSPSRSMLDEPFTPRVGTVPAHVDVAPPRDGHFLNSKTAGLIDSATACATPACGAGSCGGGAGAGGAPAPAPSGGAPYSGGYGGGYGGGGYGEGCCLTCPRWTVVVGAWIWGINGTLGAGGRRVHADSDWTDTLDNLDDVEFALDMRVRYEWSRWAVTVQVDGATLENSVDFNEGATSLGAEASLWIVQADVGYKFGPGTVGCGPCAPTLCVEGYVGARAYFTDFSFDSTAAVAPNGVSSTNSWVDPVVGFRAHLSAGDHWRFGLEGDIGGFGVGSDFSWSLVGFAAYRFNSWFGLMIGWRVLDIDYKDGNDVFDATLSGPIIGLTFEF